MGLGTLPLDSGSKLAAEEYIGWEEILKSPYGG